MLRERRKIPPATGSAAGSQARRHGQGDAAGEPEIIVCRRLELDRDFRAGSVAADAGCAAVHAGSTPEDLALLDDHERRRAAAFRLERDRRRYVAAHVGVRRLLGTHLGLPAAEVPLRRSTTGKPILALDGPPCHVSLTHCGPTAWLAVATVAIGIDAERLAPPDKLTALIAASCTPIEAKRLLGLSADQRGAAFLAAWTRKEAALKAWGSGLGQMDPSALAVGLDRSTLVESDGKAVLVIDTLTIDDMVLSIAVPRAHDFRLRLEPPLPAPRLSEHEHQPGTSDRRVRATPIQAPRG